MSGNLEAIEKAKASDHVDLGRPKEGNQKKLATSDFHISMWHRAIVSKGQIQGRVHDRRENRRIQDPTETAR